MFGIRKFTFLFYLLNKIHFTSSSSFSSNNKIQFIKLFSTFQQKNHKNKKDLLKDENLQIKEEIKVGKSLKSLKKRIK